MSVRKTNAGYWVVDFRDENGRRRSSSFGKKPEGKKRATQFDLEIKLKKSRGESLHLTRPSGIYLDQLCQIWINEKKVQGRKTEWLKDWASIFNSKFAPALTDKPCDLLTQADIIQVISDNYSESTQSTRNRYTGYLRSIFQYGLDQGHIKRNPLRYWKKGKEKGRKSMLTLDDLRHIQEKAPDHLAWAIDVAWHIPARPGPADLFSLRFDMNVNFYQGTVKIYHSKVNKWATIKCSEKFMRKLFIAKQLNESGYIIEYKGRPVTHVKKSLARAAGPKGAQLSYSVCMYDIRHLWITTMVNKGVEPSTIAYLAGTSTRMIINNYYEPHSAERDRAADKLPEL